MQNLKNPLIFVVEDNKVYNKLIVNYLKSNKYVNVEAFYSGEDCLKNINKGPDIIIQDYLLEGMNGIEVLKRVKKVKPETEFIFLSGQDSMDVAINTMKYGAFDYIVKDQMTLEKMVNKINQILSVTSLKKSKKQYKLGIILFFVVLFVIVLFIILFFFTDIFGVHV